MVKTMLKQGHDTMHNAVKGLETANRKFTRQVDAISRDEQCKPPLNQAAETW